MCVHVRVYVCVCGEVNSISLQALCVPSPADVQKHTPHTHPAAIPHTLTQLPYPTHSPSFSMAVRRTEEDMLNTSFMLNFSMATWLTTLQNAFFSGESPLTVMKWDFDIFSAPPKTSFFNISNSQGMLSSSNRPGGRRWRGGGGKR